MNQEMIINKKMKRIVILIDKETNDKLQKHKKITGAAIGEIIRRAIIKFFS